MKKEIHIPDRLMLKTRANDGSVIPRKDEVADMWDEPVKSTNLNPTKYWRWDIWDDPNDCWVCGQLTCSGCLGCNTHKDKTRVCPKHWEDIPGCIQPTEED